MRIALVIDSLGRGGAERQALAAARGLAGRRCEVELIHYYPRAPGDYETSLAGEARVTCLPKEGRPLRFLALLRDHLRRGRFDVVHSYKGAPCVYGGFAAWRAGTPVIVGGYRGGEYVEPLGIRLAHRLLGRIQHAWVVNSPAIVDELQRKLGVAPSRCHVVPNGIDPARFRSTLGRSEARARLGLDPTAPVVTSVAMLRPEKNHRMLLDAAARVLRQRSDARFLLVGDGPERAAVEGRISELGLADRVLLLGVRSDVADVLAATDVSVLTSDFEGLSNTLMESMCARLPVVSTRVPGSEALLRDGYDGRLVPVGDSARLAERLLELLDDPAERERLGRNALRSIEERYSMDAMTDGLLEVYERLLEEVRSRAKGR